MKLTRKQIENMDAGPEMRRAIAENVFGWTLIDDYEVWIDGDGIREVDHTEWWIDSNGAYVELCGLPRWDAYIAAAWEVVKYTGILCGDEPRDCVLYAIDKNRWCVAESDYTDVAEAPTAPLAICRAALLRKLEQEGSE